MDKNNIYLFVLLILSLVVTVAVTSALMLVKKAKNQEFKERTLIIFQKDEDYDYKMQFTIFQLRKTKIEFESCLFENEVKTYCAYNYPDYNDDDEVAKASIDLLDELKIQPGDTTTIDAKDIEQEIVSKYKSVFDVLTSPF